MIVMRIKGGLGNQLFQYAVAYTLSKRLDQPLRFDPSFTKNMTTREYKLPLLCVEEYRLVDDKQLPRKVQNLKNKYINKMNRVLNFSTYKCEDYIYLLETKNELQTNIFSITNKNLYIDGYFQTETYFKKYREDLLKQIRPKYKLEESYLKMLKEIKKHNSIAVHVRRSDFKKDKCAYHYLLNGDYYKRAIEEMRKRVHNPVFFWFSDDMEWVKNNIGNETNYRFVQIKTEHGDIDDMMLMKNCNHIITANSTFSWWAAWLNEHEDAIRIVPARPFGMEGMIPDEWVKIDV